LDRLISIGFGVTLGIIVSLIIWPDTSDNRALRFIRKALLNTKQRFEIEFHNIKENKNKVSKTTNNNFSSNISKAENIARSISFNDNGEILDLIDNTERLYNSITIIQRIADRSNTDVYNNDSGIEKDSKKVTKKACNIIQKFASNEIIEDTEIEEFSKLIKTTQKNHNFNIKDQELLKLRHTFIFGLTEIEDSILRISETIKNI
jgi:hypothetical protein